MNLYVHVPFCRSKCKYCDFTSYPGREEFIPAYLQALEREILSLSNLKCEINTLFVGGGTPSMLSAAQIKQLLGIIRDNFDCSGLKEFTFESNPESLSKDKLEALLDFDRKTRLSIGVQSCLDEHLQTLGRIHSTADFLEKYALALMTGFENINIDLIYGIPGQTVKGWLVELKKAVELKPQHISAYCLTVSPETQFGRDGVAVNDETTAEMYRGAVEMLTGAGYSHYEISNFALPGYECEHNKNYWRNGEYTGIGCSAVSHANAARCKNTVSLEKYIENAGTDKIKEETDRPGAESKLSETIMLGLRMRSRRKYTANTQV